MTCCNDELPYALSRSSCNDASLHAPAVKRCTCAYILDSPFAFCVGQWSPAFREFLGHAHSLAQVNLLYRSGTKDQAGHFADQTWDLIVGRRPGEVPDLCIAAGPFRHGSCSHPVTAIPSAQGTSLRVAARAVLFRDSSRTSLAIAERLLFARSQTSSRRTA